MNRHERRATAALDRAAHDAETAARTSALRRGDPLPDTVDRLALLLGCADSVRQMLEAAEAGGLESPVVLLCDLRSDLARSIIGPTLLGMPETLAELEAAKADAVGDVAYQVLGAERATAIEWLHETHPHVTRGLGGACKAGSFFVVVIDDCGVSLCSLRREGGDDGSGDWPDRRPMTAPS